MYRYLIPHKYISNSKGILLDIHESLTPEEKAELKEHLKTVQPESLAWLEKKFRNKVYYYIKAKPKERAAMTWDNPLSKYEKHLTAYFSFNYLMRCAYLLNKLKELPDENGLREILASITVFTHDAFTVEFKEDFFSELNFVDFEIKKSK